MKLCVCHWRDDSLSAAHAEGSGNDREDGEKSDPYLCSFIQRQRKAEQMRSLTREVKAFIKISSCIFMDALKAPH